MPATSRLEHAIWELLIYQLLVGYSMEWWRFYLMLQPRWLAYIRLLEVLESYLLADSKLG